MWNKLLIYLYLRKPQPLKEGEEPNFNTRVMHGINRLSIFMFLIAMIVILIRFVF
jgi:hypothetical protein